MVEAILQIVLLAAAGALFVPVLMLVLARLGYFPPIVIEVLGGTWKFAPRFKLATAATRNVISAEPQLRPVFSLGVAIVLVQLPIGSAFAAAAEARPTETGTSIGVYP